MPLPAEQLPPPPSSPPVEMTIEKPPKQSVWRKLLCSKITLANFVLTTSLVTGVLLGMIAVQCHQAKAIIT